MNTTLVSTRLRGLSIVAGGAAAVLMSVAPLAPAHAGEAPPPGNKGTIKVHRTTTPDADRRNEPKVCAFRIVGFSFPDDAHLEISIEGHGGPNAGAGSYADVVEAAELSDTGDFGIAGPSLPNGMYKLTADNTTAPGGAKHKVFKVDCPSGAESGTSGTDVSEGTTGTASEGTTGTASEGTTGTASESAGGVLGESIVRSDAAAAPGRAELPRTGRGTSALTLLGAGLLLSGAAALAARQRLARL